MKTWLITGCSRGLGRAILETVLREGDLAVGTARDTSSLEPLARAYPHTLRTCPLDVRDANAAEAAVDVAVQAFDRIDVLVNNAGYGRIAPFEEVDAADFRDQVETNLFGVVNLVRAVVPMMRVQRSGHIINVSSVGGRAGTPGLSAYQAAKWAVGGFTEVLAQEVAAFGVKVTSVEPGGMRTGWGEIAGSNSGALPADYESSVGRVLGMMDSFIGSEASDPQKVARVLFDLSRQEKLPFHLVLGTDALQVLDQREALRRTQLEEWLPVSRSVGFDDADASYLNKLET